MSVTVNDIREKFEGSSFFSLIGFEVVHYEEESAVLKLKMKEELLNVNGRLHGGIHATMLDTALGMVIRSVTKMNVVTTNLNIHYLAGVSGTEIYAEAKILQIGYKTAFAEGEIKDADGKVIAKGVGTFKILRNEDK
ncbi:PaaI family thioesterase (plasmid) [Niallia sp. XMNu-256]|uniref:PaaI family thioesterase n=1 Tax=Niallia sp. XMNu-256 TaxID=3082444 RepID=UPI0030D2E077